MDDSTGTKASLLLRLSSLGARESDLAILREALFNNDATKAKRSSNLGVSTSPTTLRASITPKPSPSARAAADVGLTWFLQREYSKISFEQTETTSPSTLSQPAVQTQIPEEMLQKLDSWFDFDIFDFASKVESEGGVLVRMGELLFDRHGFRSRYNIPIPVLRAFLTSLQSGYLDLPYHNAIHAADVAQSMSYFLVKCGLGEKGDDLMRFASIVASLGHDVGHPGYSNRYLIETRSPLALTYNDKSPLENMHASKLFTIMWSRVDGMTDITAGMDRKKEVPRFRKLCIEMILATDNAHHEKVLEHVRVDGDDENIYKAAIHAADLGGGAKTMSLSHKWANRVVSEFFRQGDSERVLGLYPVLPVMDRNNPMPKSVFQEGFTKQICLPLYMTLNNVPGLDFSIQVRALESNARHWVGATSQPQASRLKETRSFSLQKKDMQVALGRGSGNGTEADMVRSESRNGFVAYVSEVPIMRSKSCDEYETKRSDVRHRLNLSPRAFLSEVVADESTSSNSLSASSAVRDAILRSRAAKTSAFQVPNKSGRSEAASAPTSPSQLAAQMAGIGVGAWSSTRDVQSARRAAAREKEESGTVEEHHHGHRRRKRRSHGMSAKKYSSPSTSKDE